METEDQGDKSAAWILAARYTEMVGGGEGGFANGRANQEGVVILRRAYRHLTGKQMPYPLEYFTDERMRRAESNH